MFVILMSIHLTICFALVFLVLLQHGKGADMGPMGGKNSDLAFGPIGAQTWISKLTAYVAVGFMISSILLAQKYLSNRAILTKGENEPAADVAPVNADAEKKTEATAGNEAGSGTAEQGKASADVVAAPASPAVAPAPAVAEPSDNKAQQSGSPLTVLPSTAKSSEDVAVGSPAEAAPAPQPGAAN